MRNFENAKRVVIKIGTNTLCTANGVDSTYVRTLAAQIARVAETGRQVILVSSGAIGMGAKQLGLAGPVTDMKLKQACASIGQPLLMHEYHTAFSTVGLTVSQVLLTAEVLNQRKTYLNLKNAIERLLNLGVIPIVNENDCVSTAEIGTAFGDNDKLSALVASKIDADLLIMLTDIDALYDDDPRKNPDARPIEIVHEITAAITNAAGKSGSTHATGGMKTKIAAARITATASCKLVLANGKEDNVIGKIIAGEPVGTLFLPKKEKLRNRSRWILHSRPVGTIHVDPGAVAALADHKSLLPSGITSVEGTFDAGAIVMINDIAKAVTSLSSDELDRVAGHHSGKIRDLLGPDRRDVAAIPEDIVFLNNEKNI